MTLNQAELRAAVSFNLRRSFDVALIRRIQRTVGTTEDGVFGPVTVQAVAQWQADHGLRGDGKVGPLTLAAFQQFWSEQGEPVLSATEVRHALRYDHGRGFAPEVIGKIQRTVGVAETGQFDEQTVVAIARWQAGRDLVADGKVGPNTLRALEASWQQLPTTHTSYRIHPGIGIARLGDSPTEYFVGPEAPGRAVPELAQHRDANGFIKRQAARFRVYAYVRDERGELVDVHEVTPAEAQVYWTVQLVNRKAASPVFPPVHDARRRNLGVEEESLVIDVGAQTLAGAEQHVPLQGAFLGSPVRLGDLRTDAEGRLLVLGGHGVSRSPSGAALTGFANNDGWHDDVSDGPVQARVVLANGQTVEAEAAWVVVAPPRYAPEIHNVVTWWDQAFQIAARMETTLAVNEVSFTAHIYPILARASQLSWVSGAARAGHGVGKQWDFLAAPLLTRLASASAEERTLRERVYQSLRQPDGSGRMPQLNEGIDPNAPEQPIGSRLTDLQLGWMQQWALGAFREDWPGTEPVPPVFDSLSAREQPAALDRAALDECIGGPFYPGIEVGYLMARADTYGAPFRIATHHPAGFLTSGLAVPWQADFHACDERWWPAQRPVSVYREGVSAPQPWITVSRDALITAWADLGFIRRDGERYVERERREADVPA
ncbi:MAG: hypothetical protein JWN04_1853 [Myxococcaceae bacterium]|nr:hypothetical protein [Myxococcaceae bacterium]